MASDDGLVARSSVDTDVDIESTGDVTDCQAAEDFYSFQARDTIGRFCRRVLDENALTPSELLHSPRHQQTLSNLATFVGILTQAERSLGRKGAIQGLVNDVAKLTRERLKPMTLPELTPAGFAAEVAALQAKSGTQGRFFVEAGITQTIQPCRTFSEKARILIDLALSTEEPEPLACVDRFLGEIVRSDVGLASVTSDLPFATLVDAVVTLIALDKPLPETTPELVASLEKLVRRSSMPSLADGLLIAFRRQLNRQNRFTIASEGDLFGVDAVQKEISALAALADRLRTADGFLGGAKTEAAFQRRGALLVNEDTLHEIIRGRGFIQKLRTLFVLQKMPLPPTAEGAVNTYLNQFFASREFAARLLDCWKERSDKLKGIAEVQRMVLSSRFASDERERISQMLDDIQATFIRTFHVLTPITGKADPAPEQVVDVLKLAAEDSFCKGKSRISAARALYRQVHRPRFLRLFLQSGVKDRQARISWLRNALGMVGVPFIDLSSMRVLTVDDEPGPRKFVQSALRDLGIDHIEEAIDGQDAVEKLDGRLSEFNLIICDWMMPRLSGLDVLKWVRDRRADMPFLMVTALATPKAVQKAIENHVSGYIAKPFSPDQFEDKVFLALMSGGTGN